MSKQTTNSKAKTVRKTQKPLSITKVLALLAKQGGKEGMMAMMRRNELLVNGYRNPMPSGSHTSQRKRRKLARQTGIYA